MVYFGFCICDLVSVHFCSLNKAFRAVTLGFRKLVNIWGGGGVYRLILIPLCSDHSVIRWNAGAEAQDRKPAVWERPLRRHHGLRPAQSKIWTGSIYSSQLTRLVRFNVLQLSEFSRNRTSLKSLKMSENKKSIISLLVIVSMYQNMTILSTVFNQILKEHICLWYSWQMIKWWFMNRFRIHIISVV